MRQHECDPNADLEHSNVTRYGIGGDCLTCGVKWPCPTEFDAITSELRRNGWMPPPPGYSCGCRPQRLCPRHAERRAVDHYHPETIR